MKKREENKFEPEKQIDFVKLIEELDWTKEISPVVLVRTANKVGGLTGRKKYETNEVSFGALIKSFEKRVSDFVNTRFHGKDRFYTLKPEYKKEQVVYYAKTGKKLEIKEELKKKDSKFYIPEVPKEAEIEEKVKIKVKLPDDEALAKTAIMLHLLKKGGGSIKSSVYHEIREKFEWKKQRMIEGKSIGEKKDKFMTNIQEANFICTSMLEIEDPIFARSVLIKWTKIGCFDLIENKIKDIVPLIDDEILRGKVIEIVGKVEETKPKEKPVEEKKEPKPVEEVKKSVEKEFPVTKPKPEEKKPIVVKSSPVVGKSEYKEIGVASPAVYESSKVRWSKSLIAGVLRGAERGVWYNFNDIAAIIKKTRFVEMSAKEIRELIQDVSKQFKGIFRDIDFGGLVVGSETLIKDFINAYPQEKITETIFIRLKMTLEEIQETYPELKVRVASEIGPSDNIYEFEVNRAEKTEKAFCRLSYRMRKGEVILESQNNWVVKRTKILLDKYLNF